MDGVYNPNAGYAYVPLPKVACTAIKQAVAEHLGISNARCAWETPAFGDFAVTGRDLLLLQGRAIRWGFVRNPLDRLVSCWADKCSVPLRDPYIGPQLSQFAGKPFAEFARFVCDTPDEQADPHFRQQYLSLRRWNTWLVDVVWDFDDLDERWLWLQRRFGLPALERVRASSHRPYHEYYTRELAERVRERYAGDFAQFWFDQQFECDRPLFVEGDASGA